MAYDTNKIIEQRMKEKQKRIDQAIDRKEKSIAYCNSLNAAITFVATLKFGKAKNETRFEKVLEYRNAFYQKWQEWYMENMVQAPSGEIDFEVSEKQWDEHKQELADENSKIEDVLQEANAIADIEANKIF